jgi:Undecaprenyl-phosphate glucose phosphotransferase
MRCSEQIPAIATYRGASFAGVSIVVITAIADIVLMAVFFRLSYLEASEYSGMPAKVWKLTDAVFVASTLYLMVASGGYSHKQIGNPVSQISRLLFNSSAVALLEWLALWAADLTEDFWWPFEAPLNTVAWGILLMCGVRVALYKALVVGANRGVIARTVAIIGAGEPGSRLIKALERRKEPWVHLIGVFDDRSGREPELPLGPGRLGTVDDLVAYSRRNRVDEILIALPWGAETRLLDILGRVRSVPANIRLAPDVIGHHFLDRGFGRLGGVPVFDVYSKPISGWGALLKRIEDLVFGGLALLLASPLMVLCAIAIKLDSRGPVLFRQNRYGYNNTLIGVYKFRSMYHEARDANCDTQTTRRDPRITRVGAVLRRTSLDELPQLLNVLSGDMSLVGPRPHATNTKAAGRLFEEVVREYAARHKVKPGITGWAQVRGWRGETDTEEKILRRVECDLYYMENWSIFFDVEILFRTIIVVAGKNVY